MRRWSYGSKEAYDTLDPRLQTLVTRVRDEVTDITLICGLRGYRDQDRLYRNGRSTLEWPFSQHNKSPSLAVDLQPYPRPKETAKLWGALGYIAGRAHSIAAEEGFSIRWGGDWDRDGDLTNQTFDDLFHLEIIT
jgi:peptidoglycan L-alanyl-D-glutamate endopeptidase CwlK